MKQSTYSILGDEDVLFNEKFFDDQKNLVQSIDYSLRPKEEKKFYYNDKNQLIREESMIDDRVGDTQEFDYNEEGKIIEQRHFISGELYEKTIIEKTDLGETRRVLQDGDETERVERTIESDTETYKFYDWDELAQVNTIKKEGNTVTTTSLVVASNDTYTVIEVFNDEDQLLESAEYYGEGDRSSALTRSYDGKSCTNVTFENFAQPHTSYEEKFTFDENGNRIAYEKLDSSGRLAQFEKVRYNAQNKPIERAGNNGSSKFHYRIDYDDVVSE